VRGYFYKNGSKMIWQIDDPWESPFLVDNLPDGILDIYKEVEPKIVYFTREVYDSQGTST